MKRNAGIAILGGVIGTPAMTVLMYVLAPVLGVKMDIVSLLAETLGGWRMGMLVHILNGIVVFPLVFAFLSWRVLRARPFVRGLGFGVALWLGSQVIAMPIMGAGLFSSRIGGISAVLALLLGHVAYGASLGIFPIVLQEPTAAENREAGLSGGTPLMSPR
jgi:uncharacterized membrane protein YagU involved in acid resistance